MKFDRPSVSALSAGDCIATLVFNSCLQLTCQQTRELVVRQHPSVNAELSESWRVSVASR